jgi:hypothetical protein
VKTKQIFIVFSVIFISHFALAKVWTVDNHPGANFTTFAAAQTAATNGDTILIAGSISPYLVFSFTKKLYVFGPGYFLNENLNLQANPNSAKVPGANFNAGSGGSVVMGLYFTGTVTISTSNITLRRNRFEILSPSTDAIQNYASNITIGQNYIFLASTFAYRGIYLSSGLTNITISNNYIENLSNTYGAIDATSAFSGDVFNNVISGIIVIHSPNFYNNIQRSGAFTSTGSTVYNNIGNSTQYFLVNGNLQNVLMTDVFIGTGSTDGQWQLKLAGPAKGAGFGGVDCGMFENGLGNGYVLSGVPPIPSVYLFNAPADLQNVQVKIKSNN